MEDSVWTLEVLCVLVHETFDLEKSIREKAFLKKDNNYVGFAQNTPSSRKIYVKHCLKWSDISEQ